MTARAYRFGDFHLDPAARELRREGLLLRLPRRVFDGLAYLVEHRDRAVGHDELIAALWGRVDVANAQVSQLIMQLRRAVGDDSGAQRVVRTISGFGYRWVVSTQEIAAADEAAESSPPDAPLAHRPADIRNSVNPAATTRTRRGIAWRRRVAALAIVVAAVAVVALMRFRTHRLDVPSGATIAPDHAFVVLPLDVGVPEDPDAAWMRLGAMDLIASRLRRAGLPVPPSDSVVAALHAGSALPDDRRLDALRTTLGADVLVQGTVSHSTHGWKIALSARSNDGVGHRVEVERTDVIDSARQAADLLLAALGRPGPDDGNGDEVLDERLQRARAALLAGELDTANAILDGAPENLKHAPELRYELARVDYQAGRLGAARAVVSDLLADGAVAADARLHSKALRTRGWITLGEGADWAGAERDFDAAVSALNGTEAPADLGRALAERGVVRVFVHRYDDAALDLGAARSQLEIAGDRQGLGEMNNYLGQLEFVRNRVAESLDYFKSATAISESFGAVNALRYNLTAVLRAQMRLLRWSDALATAERLRALRDRIGDPGLRAASDGYRALVLAGVGRRHDAEAVLAEVDESARSADVPPDMTRFALQARAELAWQNRQPDLALAAATQALAVWPKGSSTDADQTAEVALLRQRASIAAGRAEKADIAALEPAADDSLAVYRLLAEAEWAAHLGKDAEADRLFRAADDAAGRDGVPDTTALVAEAHARWLLVKGRSAEASALAGRISVWASRDFDSALLQAAVFQARGETEAWRRALDQARGLAGERGIPPPLLRPPAQIGDRNAP